MRSIQLMTDWQSARKSLQKSLLCATVALTALSLAPAQKFWFIGPGTSINNLAQERISADDVSDNGIAVGWAIMGRNPNYQAFIFDTRTETLTIQYDEVFGNGTYGAFHAISSDGSAMAGFKGVPGVGHGVLYFSRLSYFLGSGIVLGDVIVVNGSPVAVGREYDPTYDVPAIFLFSGGAIQSYLLGTPTGAYAQTQATGVAYRNGSYFCVGFSFEGSGQARQLAILWQVGQNGEVLQRLPIEPNRTQGEDSTAFSDISTDGKTIVGRYRIGSPRTWYPFLYIYNPSFNRYERGDLPIVPDTTNYPAQFAMETNSDGTLIVGSASSSTGVVFWFQSVVFVPNNSKALLWKFTGDRNSIADRKNPEKWELVDLTEWARANIPNFPQDVQLLTAAGISDNGRFICGRAYGPDPRGTGQNVYFAYVIDLQCDGLASDITGDGQVDDADLLEVLFNFGSQVNCPQP